MRFSSSLHPEVQEKILNILENGKGMLSFVIKRYVTTHFSTIHESFRKKLLELAGKSMNFGFMFGFYLRDKLDSFDKGLKEEILIQARKNDSLMDGLGLEGM